MQECRYARYPVPPGSTTRCAGKNQTDPTNKIRSDDERTAVRWYGPDPYPNPATHILGCAMARASFAFLRGNRNAIAGRPCTASLSRSYQLAFSHSQLKSSTLGRVPPYILVKHTRESNRSPPALRSVIWVLIGPATLSFRPQESKKARKLVIYRISVRPLAVPIFTRLGLANIEESCPT